MIKLVVLLVAGDLDLVDIGHDDEITGVYVGGVDRLVLAAQAMRNTACQAPEHLVIGVDDVPIPRNVLRLGGIGFHGKMNCPVKFYTVLDGNTLTAMLSTRSTQAIVLDCGHPGSSTPKKARPWGPRRIPP